MLKYFRLRGFTLGYKDHRGIVTAESVSHSREDSDLSQASMIIVCNGWSGNRHTTPGPARMLGSPVTKNKLQHAAMRPFSYAMCSMQAKRRATCNDAVFQLCHVQHAGKTMRSMQPCGHPDKHCTTLERPCSTLEESLKSP